MADDETELSRLSGQLCFAVYSAAHAFNRAYRPMLSRLGLTYPQYLAMLVLWDRDDRTVGELGGSLFLDSGTLTPLLKRMEGAGLIRRLRDAKDERQVRVSLTDKGRALEAEAGGVSPAMACAVGLPVDEIATLAGRIHTVRELLGRSNGDGT